MKDAFYWFGGASAGLAIGVAFTHWYLRALARVWKRNRDDALRAQHVAEQTLARAHEVAREWE